MKALVYHGPGAKAWEEVPDPVILKPTDAIVRVETTTICGTDLHILKGDVPAVTDGRILGHEGVGTITEVGSAVTDLAVGDQVIISCISACGKCIYCKQGVYSHCQADEGAPESAGYSAISSTAPRPSSCVCRSPRPRCTASRTGCPPSRR